MCLCSLFPSKSWLACERHVIDTEMGAVSSSAGNQKYAELRISSVEIVTVTGLTLHKIQPEYETQLNQLNASTAIKLKVNV